ncbi:hypothetical protein RIF29_11710 [Crotalaria pallida]|uniref:Peptidase A1 domain-containing protein n=1 Tax=Crotalaria pallida TaxID=3830 RepID=A0AAN9IMG5_CROPI
MFFAFPLAAENQLVLTATNLTFTAATNNGFHSFAFRVQGNVYPLGIYTVNLQIGNPPKIFDLDIDTGSDLTWVQCNAPCKGCTKPVEQQYKPHGNDVKCADPLCVALHSTSPPNPPCNAPTDQCHYEMKYEDHSSSLGMLVRDAVPLKLTNGKRIAPKVVFGCGYDQKIASPNRPSSAGILGLGHGKISIASQLNTLGLTRNIVGHCLNGQGGYLFFGDRFIPSSGMVWTPMSQSSSDDHYTAGPADLFFNGKPTSIKGLQLIFDSGSSYSYLNSQALKTIVNLVTNDLNGKPLSRATDDNTLPICWKGARPFRSVSDVSNYFKPLAVSFTNSRNVQLQLPPRAYLIISNRGNACFGILDGTEIGVNVNLIGGKTMTLQMPIKHKETFYIVYVPFDI